MPQRSLPEKDLQEEKLLRTHADALKVQEKILDASGLAIVLTTMDGMITAFNRAAETLLGYPAQELIGKTTPVIFHDTDEIVGRGQEIARETGEAFDPAFEVVIRKAARENKPDKSEWTFIRKDGTRFIGSLTVVPLSDEAGTLTGFAGIIADQSHQIKFKEQAHFSEQKFRLLAENISGAIYLCHNDDEYNVVYLNDHIRNITGYTKEDFLSGKMKFGNLIHPDDRIRVRETINQCVAARKNFHLCYRARHASGDWRWIDETGVGVYEDDKLVMLEGFLQDVTHEKEAEEQLRGVAEENLRFFNSPVNLNAVTDFKGNLIRISPSWERVLGWTEKELRSQPLFNFIHPDDLARAQSELEDMSKSTPVHTFENRLTCKDGSYRWLLWALAPDPVAKLIYASAIDISTRKKSEETILDSKSSLEAVTLRLQEQNRNLDEFAHIISHNLRAPVSNIQALINLLDQQSEIADYKLIFEKLKNVAKNLGETMNELMDTLKAKTQPHVDLTEIRFKEVLDKVVQSLEGELIVAAASVTFDFNAAPSIVYSKPYLESIFQNLLTNAVKYRSPNRKPAIHFETSLKDNQIQLKVTDNGQGIDMEKFGDKLFGLHKTFHDHHEARGVGLFLVKTQIEALGGSIKVESEVDKGTTFMITFGNREL